MQKIQYDKNKLKINIFKAEIRRQQIYDKFNLKRKQLLKIQDERLKQFHSQTNLKDSSQLFYDKSQIQKNYFFVQKMSSEYATIHDFCTFVANNEINWLQRLSLVFQQLKNENRMEDAQTILRNMMVFMRSQQFEKCQQDFNGALVFKKVLIFIVNLTFGQNQDEQLLKNQENHNKSFRTIYSQILVDSELMQNMRFWLVFKVFPIDQNDKHSKETQNLLQLILWIIRNLSINIGSDKFFKQGIIHSLVDQLNQLKYQKDQYEQYEQYQNKFKKDSKRSYFLKCEYQMLILLSVISIKQIQTLEYLTEIDSIKVILQIMENHVLQQPGHIFQDLNYQIFQLPQIKNESTWSFKIVQQCFSALEFLFFIGQSKKSPSLQGKNIFKNPYVQRCKHIQVNFLQKIQKGRQFLKKYCLNEQKDSY